MDNLVGARPHYQKIKQLGEGATGIVFEALKTDAKYRTRQRVAIKLLKSENHVQLLRKEFARLQKIQSRFCVKLLSWETFPKGAGLVLEFLDGFNLYELGRGQRFDSLEIREIRAQVFQGLSDLNMEGLYHGDLSLKNIFVTKDGGVKLIDFGAEHSSGGSFANPIYLAPELSHTFEPSLLSDIYSLGVVQWQLERGVFLSKSLLADQVNAGDTMLALDPEKRVVPPSKSTVLGRRRLAARVAKEKISRDKQQKTQFIHPSGKTRVSKRHWGPSIFSTIAFLIALGFPSPQPKTPAASLDIRVPTWGQVSVNGLPFQYAPIYIDKMRPGTYSVGWKTPNHEGRRSVHLKPGALFLLQLDSTSL